jgi:hypothetical protein
MSSVDTVFNGEMRPVFASDPHEVLRRLKASHPDSWVAVCVGETQQIVTIPEYLYKDTYKEVQRHIRDVLGKSEFAMYKRSPARLDAHIERVSKKIIELVLKELS